MRFHSSSTAFFARTCRRRSQRGAALITAMLLAALITILAASWLARFDSHLRVTDVQRMGTQARWLLRAATDWARMILSEDPDAYDDLTEVWAVPIAPIRMTDIAGAQEAFFSGKINDAQALFNLRNLRPDGLPEQWTIQTQWAKQLMLQKGLNPSQAAQWLSNIQALPDSALENVQLFDTLPNGIDNPIKVALDESFIWLPERSLVNINTVQQDVLAAHPNIGEVLAKQVIQIRQAAPVRDAANVANSLRIPTTLAAQFSINSRYFLATGRLAVGRIDVMARSLMQRPINRMGPPKLLWSQPL